MDVDEEERKTITIDSSTTFDDDDRDCSSASNHSEKEQEDDNEFVKLFTVKEGLGYGGFGAVVRVEGSRRPHRRNNQQKKQFAMKVLPKDERSWRTVSNELTALRRLGSTSGMVCPFVQQFHEGFETPTSWCLISELIEGGDAFQQVLLRRRKLSENQARIILAELYVALEHVHACGFMHLDVKAENVMFDQHGHVKLIDFGLAKPLRRGRGVFEQRMSRTVGSLPYMAPEYLSEQTAGRHTDWWAFGIFAFELFTGCSPWSTATNAWETKDLIMSLEIHLPGHIYYSLGAQELVCGLLRKEPSERVGTIADVEIKEMLFFKQINWEKLVKLRLHSGMEAKKNTAEDVASTGDESVSDIALRAFDKLMNSSPTDEDVHFSSSTIGFGLQPLITVRDAESQVMHCYSTNDAALSFLLATNSVLDKREKKELSEDHPRRRLLWDISSRIHQ
jgi:serine/threonine protein kinase